MRTSILLFLLVAALPCAAAAAAPAAPPASPPPEKPGAALEALTLPHCDYKPDYWTPPGSLSALLAKGDFPAVERELEEFQASFERNHACENRMVWAFQNGFTYLDEMPAQLDRWVAARPKSWTAYTVRGSLWAQKAEGARGAPGWRPSEERLKDMKAWSERAVPDLERAIALDPHAVVAHASLITLFQYWGAVPEIAKAYQRAIAIDPLSVHVLSMTLTALQPSWGGPVELVDAIVADARKHEQENPRIARIYGYPDAWRALKLEWNRSEYSGHPLSKAEHREVIRLYSQALRYGEIGSDWQYRRAVHYRDSDKCESAIADSDFALAKDPGWERFAGVKVYCLGVLGRHEEALAAAREGLAHAPDSNDLRYFEGDMLVSLKRYDEAIARFGAAVAQARNAHERATDLRGLGDALLHAERYAEAERALTESTEIEQWDPVTWHNLADARWQLGKRAEAVPAYEEFLTRSEGRGWPERTRMQAQERINTASAGAEPPAATPER